MEGRGSKRSIIVAALAALLCALAVSMAMGPSTLLLAEETTEETTTDDSSSSTDDGGSTDEGTGSTNEDDSSTGSTSGDETNSESNSDDTNSDDTESGDTTEGDGTSSEEGSSSSGDTGDDSSTDESSTDDAEEETTTTAHAYTYYTFIDADGDEYLIVMRDDWSYVVLEEVTDGVGGVTWGYDVSDNGDGTYTLTKIDADASDLFHAEYIVYLGDDGIVYEVVDTEEETTEATESDEETLAQTGDGASTMVAGVASMGAIALAAGVLAGKRRKA